MARKATTTQNWTLSSCERRYDCCDEVMIDVNYYRCCFHLHACHQHGVDCVRSSKLVEREEFHWSKSRLEKNNIDKNSVVEFIRE